MGAGKGGFEDLRGNPDQAAVVFEGALHNVMAVMMVNERLPNLNVISNKPENIRDENIERRVKMNSEHKLTH